MSKREDEYIAALQAMGVYSPAFRPVVHELCILERELSRARKEWQGSKAADEKHVSLSSPLYDRVRQLRTDILAYQNALGLTPTGLKRLKGKELSKEKSKGDEITERLDKIREAVERYG